MGIVEILLIILLVFILFSGVRKYNTARAWAPMHNWLLLVVVVIIIALLL